MNVLNSEKDIHVMETSVLASSPYMDGPEATPLLASFSSPLMDPTPTWLSPANEKFSLNARSGELGIDPANNARPDDAPYAQRFSLRCGMRRMWMKCGGDVPSRKGSVIDRAGGCSREFGEWVRAWRWCLVGVCAALPERGRVARVGCGRGRGQGQGHWRAITPEPTEAIGCKVLAGWHCQPPRDSLSNSLFALSPHIPSSPPVTNNTTRQSTFVMCPVHRDSITHNSLGFDGPERKPG